MKQSMLFKGKNAELTKATFTEFLTPKEAWFGTLLYSIKEGWIKNGCAVTEILLRENQPIAVAVLKAYIPCAVKDGDKEFLPTVHHIEGVVTRFTGRKLGTDGDALVGESIDFAFQVFGLGIFRVNFSYSSDGAQLSIRYLPFDVPKLGSVGYPKIYQDYLQNMIEISSVKSPEIGNSDFYIQVGEGNNPATSEKPNMVSVKTHIPRSGGGLIVHIGPTGSGKTTAMAAEVDFIATATAGLIITYEDPIEYQFYGTTSPVAAFELGVNIKKSEDFTLSEMVRRHSLRKNPSVIMFGEMRTAEQMRMVVGMANSGHWVLASMHGQTVVEAIGILAAIFKDEPHILANSLKAAVAHRLATTSKGEIVPLFEIFIPDTVRIEALSKGNLDEIKTTFKEGLGDQSTTFEQSIENLLDNDLITVAEKESIEKMTLGNLTKKG